MNDLSKLYELAKKASTKAYAPYSKFKVGAAILSSEGNFHIGCNVENISYPLGSCAEQSAISSMISSGDSEIAKILIYADSKNLITPCGACRQRIAEFANSETLIYLADSEGIKETHTLDEILPFYFKEL